jgi:hypothetical protein
MQAKLASSMRRSPSTTLSTTGTGEGALDVEEDNIPSARLRARVLRASSLSARNGLAGGGLVDIPWTLVRYVQLPLSGLFVTFRSV